MGNTVNIIYARARQTDAETLAAIVRVAGFPECILDRSGVRI
jgi:hypothetical protein